MERALRIAGFADRQIRRIPGGSDYRMDPHAVSQAIARDRAAGLKPALLAANGGATNTGAVDPLGALADLVSSVAGTVGSTFLDLTGLDPTPWR